MGTTKICSKCRQELNTSLFNKKGKKLQSYCKDCQKELASAHYRNHKDSYKAKGRYYKIYLSNIIQSYKNRACADCKQRFPSYVMDFDYKEGNFKSFGISASSGKGRKSILFEMSKCDVVCSNCLKIRQHKYLQ
jgi:hypothetical protein